MKVIFSSLTTVWGYKPIEVHLVGELLKEKERDGRKLYLIHYGNEAIERWADECELCP